MPLAEMNNSLTTNVNTVLDNDIKLAEIQYGTYNNIATSLTIGVCFSVTVLGGLYFWGSLTYPKAIDDIVESIKNQILDYQNQSFEMMKQRESENSQPKKQDINQELQQ